MFAKNNSTLNLLNKVEYADGLRDGSGSPQTCLSVARTTSEQPELQFLTWIEPPQPHPLKILCKNIIVNQAVIKVR